MKQFHSVTLFLLMALLVAGCGTNDNPDQTTNNSQVNDQNKKTSAPKQTKTNTETDLKQRTGVRFQPIESSRDTLPLLVIMANLEQNMAALQGGIWRGNYEVIEKAATNLANHAKIPKREIKKIRAILGQKGLKNFVAADKYWHKKAKELAQVADQNDMEQVVNLTTEMVQRCASCHIKYREPLRDDPRWRKR